MTEARIKNEENFFLQHINKQNFMVDHVISQKKFLFQIHFMEHQKWRFFRYCFLRNIMVYVQLLNMIMKIGMSDALNLIQKCINRQKEWVLMQLFCSTVTERNIL